MIDEEKAEYKKSYNRYLRIAKKIKDDDDRFFFIDFLLKEGRKNAEKENAKLKAQISTLLSCSNCPDNKGGYICAKEYNNKCLAQKIQYIKELKEEIEKMKCCENCKHCEFKIVSDGSTRAICTRLKGDVCLSNNYDNWEAAE